MSFRRVIPVVLIALAGGALPSSAGGAPMYWGARIDGDVYGRADAPWDQTTWNRFERNAGKKVTILSMGQPWGAFDASAFETIRRRGAIPLLTMGLEGTTLADVAAGRQDAVIRAWAQRARAYGSPFLFRPWWEMNGTWYAWGRSPDFVPAWQRFHDLVVAEGATNVTWAWVVNGIWSDPASDPAIYYPGDAYVDWTGVDSFNWGTNPLKPDRWETPDQVLSPTLDRLEEIAPGKPVVVSEIASTEYGGNKAGWIKNLLSGYLPNRPQVKALVWFNWNIREGTGRLDWPIESSSTSQASFKKWIQDATYRSTLPALSPLAPLPLP